MATAKTTVDTILSRLETLDVRARAMFGEYGLYCDDKVVAFICDNSLFVKPTKISEQFLDETHLAPAYPGSKDYYAVPKDKLADSVWLTNFIHQTAEQLPKPKPKKTKR